MGRCVRRAFSHVQGYCAAADAGRGGAQIKLMTSWAVVCDVYFLEPQAQQPGETAMQFAERVQALVAARAKLVIAPWDGCALPSAPSADCCLRCCWSQHETCSRGGSIH